MTLTLRRLSVLLAGVSLLASCIPIRKPVAIMGNEYLGQEIEGGLSNPQAVSHLATTPLTSGEGIVFLGWKAASDVAVRGRADTRYDDSMAACVRDAVAKASPETHIVPLSQFRPAAGGVFSSPTATLNEENIADGLRLMSASPTLAALNARYLFMVEGSTKKSNGFSTSGGFYFDSGQDRRIHLTVTGWDTATGQKQISFTSDTSGTEGVTLLGGVGFLAYAPTESTACKDIAGRILRYLSGTTNAVP